jgi:hypothetical protein
MTRPPESVGTAVPIKAAGRRPALFPREGQPTMLRLSALARDNARGLDAAASVLDILPQLTNGAPA